MNGNSGIKRDAVKQIKELDRLQKEKKELISKSAIFLQ